MPSIDDADYDDALPKLEAQGLIPKGADARTAADAMMATLTKRGYTPEDAGVVAQGVHNAIIRRGINAKQYDPELLAASGLEGMVPKEAQRWYAGMQDPDMQAQAAGVVARSQGPYSSVMEGIKRSVGESLGGLAGNVGAWTGNQTLQEIGTQQRMLAAQAAASTDSPNAYHIGAMAGGILPAASGNAAMGAAMAGSTMSALQAQDVGALGQAAAGATVGYLGAKLPAVTQGWALAGANKLASGIAAKIGAVAAVKTVPEILNAMPTVTQTAGRVLVGLGGGAAQYPGMVAANAAGTAVGQTFNGDPMLGLRQAWEQAKAAGDPIGWLEFAALHGVMKTGGSLLGGQGTIGERLIDPYRQPELAAREGWQQRMADRVNTTTEEGLANRARIDAAEESGGYNEQVYQGEDALAARRRDEARQAELDAAGSDMALTDAAVRETRLGAERKYADLRAATDLEAERQAAQEKFLQEEIAREEAYKAEAARVEAERADIIARREADARDEAERVEAEQQALRDQAEQEAAAREQARQAEVDQAEAEDRAREGAVRPARSAASARQAKDTREAETLQGRIPALELAETRRAEALNDLKTAQDDAVRQAARGSEQGVKDAQARIADARRRAAFWAADASKLPEVKARIAELQARVAKPLPEAVNLPKPVVEPEPVNLDLPRTQLSPVVPESELPKPPAPFQMRPVPADLAKPITPDFGKAKPKAAPAAAPAAPESKPGGFKRAVAPDAPVVANPPFAEPTKPEARFPKGLVATSGEAHPLGKGKLDTVPTPEAEALGKELAVMHPAFQGNKANIQPHTFTALQNRWTPEQRSKITHLDERFAGGGGYGLSVASSGLLPNLKKITVRELDPVRAAKIKWVYDNGERFNEIVQDNAAQLGNVLERMYFQAREDGASTASMSAVIARLHRFMATPEGQALPEDVKQVLAHWAQAGRGYEDWQSHMTAMAKSAIAQARAAKAFRAKGGEINVVHGDSYAAPVEPGKHVLMLADPPYVHTKGYGESVVSGDTYEKTHQLLRSAADAGNHIIYHDSAWMAREPGDTMHDTAAGDQARSFRTLRNIGRVLPDMNVVRARTQSEILGVRNAESALPSEPAEPESAGGGSPRPAAGSQTAPSTGTGPAEPARPGAAAPAPAAKPVDRTVTDAHRNDAKALAPLIGHDADIKVNDNGSVTFTGKQGKATVSYEDKALPAEQVNRGNWLRSILGANRRKGLDSLKAWLKEATLPATIFNAAADGEKGLPFAVEALGKLKPEQWKKLYDLAPVAGRTIRDDTSGADLGALVALHRTLSGTEGGASVLREEYGHHLWLAMEKHAPELVQRILKTELSKAEQADVFGLDGKIKDPVLAMEIGTAKVNRALDRMEADRIKKGPPATGFLASVWRFLSKLLPKSLTEDPALRPSEEAAKLWSEGKLRPEYAGKPGEAYAVRPRPAEGVAPTVTGAAQSMRRAEAAQAKEEAGGPEKVADWIADAERMQRDHWEDVSNAGVNDEKLTPDMIVPVRFELQDRLKAAAERGGVAAMRDLEWVGKAGKKLQEAGTDAAKLMRKLQFDVNRESDVTRLLQDKLYASRAAYWARKVREAKGDEATLKKLGDQYARDIKTVVGRIRNKYGIDITRPDIGNLFHKDAYGVRALAREIDLATPKERGEELWDWYNRRFSFGGLYAEVVRNSILGFQSGIPQAAGAALFGVRSLGKRITDDLISRLGKDADKMGGFEGTGQVFRETGDNLFEAAKTARDWLLEGRSVARERMTGKLSAHSIEGETAGGEHDLPVIHHDRYRRLSAAVRTAIGPGAVLTGFVDEFVWAMSFRQHQTFAAARKRAAGDARPLEEIKQDQDILDNAEKEADFVTMRGGYHGPLAPLAEGAAKWRSPVKHVKVGDEMHVQTHWAGLPGFALMPIYKGVVKALAEAAATANPGNLAHLARGFQGRAAAEKESIASGKTVETIMEERRRLAAEAGGRVMMAALAGTIGALWANAPQQGKDANLKESAAPQGNIGDVPASRFSPYYEITQLGAIGRQAMQEAGAKGSKLALNNVILSSYDAFLNRPLLTGFQLFNRKASDPETGQPLMLTDKLMKIAEDETALGRPYIDLIRKATESDAKASDNYYDRNYSLSREARPEQFSGEARDKGGFLRQMVFGGESNPSPKERALVQRIVKANDGMFKQAGDNPVKQENAVWVPSRIDALIHEDKALGQQWRMTPAELRVAQKAAGQEFARIMESMPEDPNPAVEQIRMRSAWGHAQALAKAIGTQLAMPRIIADRQKLLAQR